MSRHKHLCHLFSFSLVFAFFFFFPFVTASRALCLAVSRKGNSSRPSCYGVDAARASAVQSMVTNFQFDFATKYFGRHTVVSLGKNTWQHV